MSQDTSEKVYIGSLFEVKYIDQSQDSLTTHIFAGSQRICSLKTKDQTSSLAYYHGDHLGSSNIITDEDGEATSLTEYYPYGSTSNEQLLDPEAELPDYKFTGKELDASTGFYYYGARYYDPQIGRFISADTIVQAPYDPQSLNRYSYCRNNPVKYIDPSGHFPWVAAIVAAIIGAAAGAAIAAVTGSDIGIGAITGAIAGFLFFTAGTMIEAAGWAQGGFAATITHTVAGAISGVASAGITGGDYGMSALISGVSAGAAYWAGNNISILKATKGESLPVFMANVSKRALIGAVIGGGISEITGGDFWYGFKQGGMTAGIGYTTNCAGALAIPAVIGLLDAAIKALVVTIGIVVGADIIARNRQTGGFYLHGTTEEQAKEIDATKEVYDGTWATKPNAPDPSTGKTASGLNPSQYQRFVGITPPKGEYFALIYAPKSSVVFVGIRPDTGAPEYLIYGPHKVMKVYKNPNN
jgi:RHS repeat-associated protein